MTRRKDPQPDGAPPESPSPEADQAQPFVVEIDPLTPAIVDAPADEPVAASDRQPAPPPHRNPGILAPLLGGALAALGGFALAHFNVFGLSPPDPSAAVTTLTADVAAAKTAQSEALGALDAKVAELSGRLNTLETAPPATAPDLSQIDALDQRLAKIEAIPADGAASTAALTAKLADLEQRLASLPSGGSDPAMLQKVDDALARLDQAEAAATARMTEAAAVTTAAERGKALDTLSAAVATGQPFATELQALNDPALSEALGTLATTGVPTLASLQAGFPDAARSALQLSRKASNEDGWGTRFVDFLAAQTGARSVTPRDGADPDAILSRAEFALAEGRVADALAELQALDPVVKAPLDPWITEGTTYVAATTALNAARGD
jgi:hypothetical protein